MPDEDWQKMVTGYIDYYGEGDVPDWVNPKKIIDTSQKTAMWNKINVELARVMTKTLPAIRDGRGMDILRTELALYPRKEIKEKRKTINKLSQEYLGVKPFKIGKDKETAEEKLRKLVFDLKG